MNRLYKALLWISQKLVNLGFNAIIRKIHDSTTIPLINRKALEYMRAGHNENQAIIEALYDLDFISDKEIQVLREYLNYGVNKMCKNGQSHSFGSSTGKCFYCGIIGCAAGLESHSFGSSTGKCFYCGIIGCAVGLESHSFLSSTGKCFYCGILGCQFGLESHSFSSSTGKCFYCGIHQ